MIFKVFRKRSFFYFTIFCTRTILDAGLRLTRYRPPFLLISLDRVTATHDVNKHQFTTISFGLAPADGQILCESMMTIAVEERIRVTHELS